jgi:hypothetical protein
MYFWYSVRQRSMLPSCSSISMYDLNSLSYSTGSTGQERQDKVSCKC